MGSPRPRLRALLSVLAAVLVTAVAATPASAAKTPKRTAPQGYIGMNISDGALDPRFPLEQQMKDMVRSGVESIVTHIPWATMQPVQGGPIDFAQTDRIALTAARLRMTFVPVVVFAPPWGALFPERPTSPPQSAGYGTFVSALVKRYGPGGELWKANPGVKASPIRTWQIWNEPNLKLFWDQDQWETTYVSVLKAAHDAIKAADPKGKVALAGLVNTSWEDLASLYKAGAKGLFDVLALHPYTGLMKNVLRIVKYNRDVLNRNGGRKIPIILTESGWPPSDGYVKNRYGFEVKLKDLPKLIKDSFPEFVRARKLYNVIGFYWYSWATADASPDYAFDYAGLRTITSPSTTKDKISLAAYKRAALRAEGCRSKGSTATSCRR